MYEAQLLEHVASAHRAEVSGLYGAYLATIGGESGDDIDHFAKMIFERGLLSADGLKDFMTYHELGGGHVELARDQASTRRYEIVTRLGSGSMGEVFLGRDATLKRTVAIKRVHPNIVSDAVQVRRFLHEAQITAQLDHPAIVPVYGLEDIDRDAPAYAMKFVNGVTLSRFLEEASEQIARQGTPDGSHSLRARVELLVPVLNAIAYAHRRGVLHRDLKPDNIMIGRFGQVLVMDWGIARVMGHPDEVDTWRGSAEVGDTQLNLTRTGTVIGTPMYMSPEQTLGEELDAASDQYTLGLILQEVATLLPARRAPSTVLMLELASQGHRQPIGDGAERVPRALGRIIDKATALEPARRYASVEALADDVRRFLADQSTEVDPDRGLAHVTRWIGRHRGLAAALTAAIVLLAFALVMLFDWQGERALRTEREVARRHELAMSGLEGLVDAQGKRMTDRLLRYEALLEGIVGGAVVALGVPAPPSDVVAYRYHDGLREPAELPLYVVPSRAYGRPASLRAEYSVAWGADREALRPRLDQLARVEPLLRTALLRSASEDAPELPFADAEKLVLDHGAPLVLAYFSTDDGLGVGVPGTWESYDSNGATGYDHRREAWYRMALETRGPIWTVAADESQLGLTVSCLEAVRDPSGRVLGVAGVDAWLSRFIAELLEVPALAATGAEALLLDAHGAVIVRSTARAAAALTHYVPVPYEDEPLRLALASAPLGRYAVQGERLALWTRLGSTGMTYLVVGPEAAMTSASTTH